MKMILAIASVCSFIAGAVMYFIRRGERIRFSELDMKGYGAR